MHYIYIPFTNLFLFLVDTDRQSPKKRDGNVNLVLDSQVLEFVQNIILVILFGGT